MEDYLGRTQTAEYAFGPMLLRSKTCFDGPKPASFGTSFAHPGKTSTRPIQFQKYPCVCRRDGGPPTYGSRDDATMNVGAGGALDGGLTDGVQVPPGYAAIRNGIDTKFTPDDWKTAGRATYSASDRARSAAELLRMDATRVCRDVIDRTAKSQDDVAQKLGDRVKDISFWKREIQNELDAMAGDANEMVKANKCLERALGELTRPLEIAQECLLLRQGRNGIDLVQDEVELQLLKVGSSLHFAISYMASCAYTIDQLHVTAVCTLSMLEIEMCTFDSHFG